MKKQKKIINNEYGITLVTLVVTLIILLLLAGITVGVISGEGNIVNNAQNASTRNETEEIKEKIQIEITKAVAKSKTGVLNDTQIRSILEKYGEVLENNNKISGVKLTLNNVEIGILELYKDYR